VKKRKANEKAMIDSDNTDDDDDSSLTRSAIEGKYKRKRNMGRGYESS
ncbi:471_t:CDS:1, partial [Scutellospora calospora]